MPHKTNTASPNPIHRLVQRLAATPFGTWLVADNLHWIDAPLLKWSHNRASLTTWLTGLPVVVITTTGAKSGLPRQTPLVGLVNGGSVILIASQFGRPHNPAWYHNLKAHPQVQVSSPAAEGIFQAREALGEERRRYWQMAAELYPGYTLYEQRAAPRVIPVMVLEPAKDPIPNPTE